MIPWLLFPRELKKKSCFLRMYREERRLDERRRRKRKKGDLRVSIF